MNEKLLIIKDQLEKLSKSINEYLESISQEEIIIKPENYNKIKYLGKTRFSDSVFDYNNGSIFSLNPRNSYEIKFFD